MRLVCPRCDAEYEIDERLIPASGREVECSSCENVWFQAGRLRMPAPVTGAGDAPGDAPPDAGGTTEAPPMARPLAEDVMSILRAEAAHFRASHPGIDAAAQADAAPADPDAMPAPGDAPVPDLPVAAGIGAEPDADIPPPAEGDAMPAPAPPMPQAASQATARGDQRDTGAQAAHGIAMPRAVSVSDAAPAAAPPPPAVRRGGFGKGFLIGLLIAAVVFGLYLAAPHAGEGMAGGALRAMRAAGESLHQWIRAQVPWP